MKNTEENKLDNPVWNSLAESHLVYAIDYDGTQFYDPDYCPFTLYIHKICKLSLFATNLLYVVLVKLPDFSICQM
jgi:hypothetical protein